LFIGIVLSFFHVFKLLKKKIILSAIIFILSFGLFFYYTDPLEINYSLFEKAKTFWKSSDPVSERVKSLVGVPSLPKIYDTDFEVEEFVVGLDLPTTMAFVGSDVLVLEKNYGKVRLIRDGVLQKNPVLDVEVTNSVERGMLGILPVGSTVYLYYTKSDKDGGEPEGNYIYRYTWDGNTLKDPLLVNILPGYSRIHNGGAMTIGLDGKIYAVIGDQRQPPFNIDDYGILQNKPNGDFDDTGIILRVGLDESVVQPSLSKNPLNHYYAIGIRNSFGLAVDPITGNMWDTENGADKFDEINLVLPKFNSGWVVSMGPSTIEQISTMSQIDGFTYSDPEFSWEGTIAPTGLLFADSENFQKYRNDLFVGSCNSGILFKFILNEERTGFVFNDPNLVDLVVNVSSESENFKNLESMEEISFGENFGCITDLEIGPDGNMYVVSITNGAIYKIYPK